MNLRPHHLLCIQKFTGHGYDAAFTAHMSSVVSELASKNIQITLIKGCDDLCSACPNQTDGICTSLEKVDFMDNTVLCICDFSYGDTLSWEEAAKKAREQISETEKFGTVCASCEWFELCKNTENPAVWKNSV